MARVTQEYNLQITNPNLAKQWHPAKNATLTPNVVAPMSGKKVWWICRKGHEWEAHISNRSNGIGCPYCSGKRPSEGKNLQVANPRHMMGSGLDLRQIGCDLFKYFS